MPFITNGLVNKYFMNEKTQLWVCFMYIRPLYMGLLYVREALYYLGLFYISRPMGLSYVLHSS